jgi:hypothetical protein
MPSCRRWWRETFVPGQLLPYAVVYVDGVRADKAALLLYRIRHFFPSRREICPAPEDLRLDHDAYLTYADRQYFLFSLKGATFVAFDAPATDFFRRELPDHLRVRLYLLALHRRFTLIQLSEAVSDHWLGRLLTFTARGYFTNITTASTGGGRRSSSWMNSTGRSATRFMRCTTYC